MADKTDREKLNPYPVCRSRMKNLRPQVRCSEYYANEWRPSESELHALAELHKKSYEEYKAYLGIE